MEEREREREEIGIGVKENEGKPVIRMNNEVHGEASDSMEKRLATELAPSRVESQLVLYEIEPAPSRRFQPVTQVLHLVLSLIRRRRRRGGARRRRGGRRRRRLLPLVFLFRRRGCRRLHILLPRHFQEKKKNINNRA